MDFQINKVLTSIRMTLFLGNAREDLLQLSNHLLSWNTKLKRMQRKKKKKTTAKNDRKAFLVSQDARNKWLGLDTMVNIVVLKVTTVK